ncbi:testis-expressed protein 36 [Genypterus blacodes]|uniref:testis-expressed protein 36 n=1 Tax=Genypterus blacodes TaxID=154954 RepID=UPI003F766D1A
MVKGGRQYSSRSTDGLWFAHAGLPESSRVNRETHTSTGIMQTQINSALPQALNCERYPKWKSQQKSREYPLSDHDNKDALKDNVMVFEHGVGRKKGLVDQRQHNSHFCLCHDEDNNHTQDTMENHTVYQSEYLDKQKDAAPAIARRFTRNHQQKSAEAAAAAAQAGEEFMWFGRDNSGATDVSLEVLAVSNCLACRKARDRRLKAEALDDMAK